MRITQNSLSRNYLKRMNKNYSDLYLSNMKLSSQKKYSRVSENTAETSRAFQIREQIYRNEQWNTNMKNAQGEISTAENSLITANNYIKEVTSRIIQGVNGTLSDEQRDIIAQEFQSIQDEIIQLANTKFGDKYVFANSGKLDEPPFKRTANGIEFNGYPVDEIVVDPNTGALMGPNKDGRMEELKYNKDIYIDIGIGFNMTGSRNNVELDKTTAFKLSTSGLDAFGFGKDPQTGKPMNLISAMDELIKATKDNNITEMQSYLDHFDKLSNNILTQITDIGVRSTYIEDNLKMNEDQNITFKETQNLLEGIDISEEIIHNKTREMSWMVTLQMGSKLIPPSIFDFLR